MTWLRRCSLCSRLTCSCSTRKHALLTHVTFVWPLPFLKVHHVKPRRLRQTAGRFAIGGNDHFSINDENHDGETFLSQTNTISYIPELLCSSAAPREEAEFSQILHLLAFKPSSDSKLEEWQQWPKDERLMRTYVHHMFHSCRVSSCSTFWKLPDCRKTALYSESASQARLKSASHNTWWATSRSRRFFLAA